VVRVCLESLPVLNVSAWRLGLRKFVVGAGAESDYERLPDLDRGRRLVADGGRGRAYPLKLRRTCRLGARAILCGVARYRARHSPAKVVKRGTEAAPVGTSELVRVKSGLSGQRTSQQVACTPS